MGGSSMGIWCAHGEGRAHFPDPQVKQAVLEGGLAPIRLPSFCQYAGLAMGLPSYHNTSQSLILVFINYCCPVVHHLLNNLAQLHARCSTPALLSAYQIFHQAFHSGFDMHVIDVQVSRPQSRGDRAVSLQSQWLTRGHCSAVLTQWAASSNYASS